MPGRAREAINVARELARIPGHWSPRIAAEVNDTHVKLARLLGEFVLLGEEHRPVAPEECQVLLVEPRRTLNTGTEVTDRTVAEPEWI